MVVILEYELLEGICNQKKIAPPPPAAPNGLLEKRRTHLSHLDSYHIGGI